MKFMGRTNWGIKNTNRASLIMMFIPGLQGAAMDAQKVKKYLQHAQTARLVSYLKTLSDIKRRGCPLDPRMLITPFKLGRGMIERDSLGAARLREEQWTYYFFQKPYLLDLSIKAQGWEQLRPRLQYQAREKAAKLSSLWSSL